MARTRAIIISFEEISDRSTKKWKQWGSKDLNEWNLIYAEKLKSLHIGDSEATGHI